MLVKKAIDELADRTKTSDTAKRPYLLTKLNFSVAAYWRSANWDFRYKTGQIVLIPNITGSCSYSVFNGSNEGTARIVTISSPTVIQGWIGRYFQVNGSSDWHKIIGVDVTTSTIVLDSPLLVSATTFTIWKRIYSLCSDCDQLISFYPFNGEGELQFRHVSKMVGDNSSMGMEGTPQRFSGYGVDNYQDVEYSTGSITGSANSIAVTGSGTSFIENVSVGDIIRVNENEYTVKRVESDTRLILYTCITDAFTNSNFSIVKNNPVSVQLYANTDRYRILTYDYFSKPYNFNNEDCDYLPFDKNTVDYILKRAEAEVLSDKTDMNAYQVELAVAEGRLSGLKKTNKTIVPRYSQFEPLINRNLPGRE